MEDVTIHKADGITVCKINNFSDGLKGFIRSDLSSMCYGKSTVDEDASYYSYERTIKKFVDIFDNKLTDLQRMGVIGELLAHLLISRHLPELSIVTLIMSKEEDQIHKGFDFVYISKGDVALWYGEAKSGELQRQTPTQKNKDLLNTAKSGIVTYLNGTRDRLWDSAVIEANQTLVATRAITARQMLRDDLLAIQGDEGSKKNALLVSIVFHDVNNPFDESELSPYLHGVKAEGVFNNVMIFSIQKSTYSKVIDFLHKEAGI